MEFSDFTDKPLHLLFLDWKQAFDSVDHNALLIALRRFGISEDLLALIHSIYDAPTSEVKGLNGVLAQGEVRAGIRQGCPLSPYLFIMVLTVLLEDVDQALLRSRGRYPVTRSDHTAIAVNTSSSRAGGRAIWDDSERRQDGVIIPSRPHRSNYVFQEWLQSSY